MAAENTKLPSRSDSASISKPSISKLQKLLDERIDLTEAIKLATQITSSYPDSGRITETYLGAIASILQDYPASVARRCANKGIVLVCKFLPTVADIVTYCEGFTQPLYKQTETLMRRAQQFKEREDYEKRQAERPKRLSIQELKEKYGDWTNAWQPVPGAEDKYKPPAERPVGSRANVKVLPQAPQFGAVKGAIEAGTIKSSDWRDDADGSLWISLSAFHAVMGSPKIGSFKTMSDAELRAYYGQREAESAKQYAAKDHKAEKSDPFADL
jgi:hypothetical protein